MDSPTCYVNNILSVSGKILAFSKKKKSCNPEINLCNTQKFAPPPPSKYKVPGTRIVWSVLTEIIAVYFQNITRHINLNSSKACRSLQAEVTGSIPDGVSGIFY
jgi:hypothetical protein